MSINLAHLIGIARKVPFTSQRGYVLTSLCNRMRDLEASISQAAALDSRLPAPKRLLDSVKAARERMEADPPSNDSPAVLTAGADALLQALDAYLGLCRDAGVQVTPPTAAFFDGWLYESAYVSTLAAHIERDWLCYTSAVEGPPVRPLVRDVSLVEDVVKPLLPDLQAFTVQKFGVVPAVRIDTDLQGQPPHPGSRRVPASGAAAAAAAALRCVTVPEHVTFILSEVLKNSYKAMIDRWTPAGVDDAPPVVISFSTTPTHVTLRVEDRGGGLQLPRVRPAPGAAVVTGAGSWLQWPAASERHPVTAGGTAPTALPPPAPLGSAAALQPWASPLQPYLVRTQFPYLQSDTVASRGDSSDHGKYSRDFGTQFSGQGLGLPRCRLYATLLEGWFGLLSQPGRGVEAMLVLPKRPQGTAPPSLLPHLCAAAGGSA